MQSILQVNRKSNLLSTTTTITIFTSKSKIIFYRLAYD